MKNGEKFINLFMEMTRAGIEWKDLEEVIGKTRTTIYMKKSGKVDWTLQEMLDIQEYLNMQTGKTFSLDYLFEAEF